MLIWRDKVRLGLSRLAFLGLLLVGVLATLFEVRRWLSSSEVRSLSPMELLLTQGSNPIIDTNILQAVDSGRLQLNYGWSYLTALVTRFGAWRTEASLSEWFVPIFFPLRAGASFFGFSLEAEAYLAGGYVGVVIVFILLGLLYGCAYSSFQRDRPLGSYLYLVLATLGLYAVRNESRMLLGGLSYALIVFASAYVAGWIVDLARQPTDLRGYGGTGGDGPAGELRPAAARPQ